MGLGSGFHLVVVGGFLEGRSVFGVDKEVAGDGLFEVIAQEVQGM